MKSSTLTVQKLCQRLLQRLMILGMYVQNMGQGHYMKAFCKFGKEDLI